LNDIAKKPEETNEIAFSSTVGPDQHIECPKLEVLQFPDGFETFDRELPDSVGHEPSPSISETSTLPPKWWFAAPMP
jgi:hypothetical protein